MSKCKHCGRKAVVHPNLRLCRKCLDNPFAKPASRSEKWWLK